MRKTGLITILLITVFTFAAIANTMQSEGALNWSTQQQWNFEVTPLAFVQSLDNKKTFILGDDSKVHVYGQNGTKLGAMTVSPDITDIDIAPRGETIYLVNKKEKSFTALDISFTQNLNIANAPILGNPQAPVTLVEFSDFECPYCSKVKPVLEKLLAANPDTLKVAFKHLPLRIHKQAEPAAKAAIAAQKQGKFWEMHDELFKIKKMTPQAIDQAAVTIGLDIEQFNKDKNSVETRQQLAQDMFEAQQAEVTGTPTLFIDGIRVQNRSPQAMQEMIDAAAKKGAQ